MSEPETQERRYLALIQDAAVIPPGKEEDVDLLRSRLVLCGIWAGAGLMPPTPAELAIFEGDPAASHHGLLDDPALL